jgi:hypothetical protein
MAFKLTNPPFKHCGCPSEKKAGKAKSSAFQKIKRTKISPACKAAAKRKFKVWPSAYASGWGVRCTRNPSKYLKR